MGPIEAGRSLESCLRDSCDQLTLLRFELNLLRLAGDGLQAKDDGEAMMTGVDNALRRLEAIEAALGNTLDLASGR